MWGVGWRQLLNFYLNRLQASAYASDDGVLTVKMIDESTEESVRQHGRKMQWLAMERAAVGIASPSGKFAQPTPIKGQIAAHSAKTE